MFVAGRAVRKGPGSTMVTYGVYCVAFGMQSAAGMTDSEESRSALRGQLADTTYLGVRFLLVSRAEGARAVILTY